LYAAEQEANLGLASGRRFFDPFGRIPHFPIHIPTVGAAVSAGFKVQPFSIFPLDGFGGEAPPHLTQSSQRKRNLEILSKRISWRVI
jgi:hypothetical protein